MWLLLVGGLGFCALALAEPAPIFVWVILAGYNGLVLWSLIKNPIHGIRLSGDILTIAPQGENRTVALANIEYMKINDRGDSSDYILYLGDGTLISLNEIDVPSSNETARVFQDRGVEVRRL